MAFCNADTSVYPRADAALLSPPYFRASAETLCPWQFAFPGVPANRAAGWMKLPTLIGNVPTGTTAVATFVAVSTTVTLFASEPI